MSEELKKQVYSVYQLQCFALLWRLGHKKLARQVLQESTDIVAVLEEVTGFMYYPKHKQRILEHALETGRLLKP